MGLVSLMRAVAANRAGAVPHPAWCTYVVTDRCNARCGMCDSWRLRPTAELSVAEVDELFSRIGRLDVVRLTGGEPFLRDDLPEIAEAITTRSRPRVLHVTTNGSRPERVEAFARGFRRPRRLRVMVSFDGLAAEHDRSRGANVTFDRALDTVRRLARQRDRRGLAVSANHTVISPASLADHEGLRAELGRLGVEVHSVLAYAASAMYGVALRGTRADHLIVPRGYPLHPALAGADVVGFVGRQLEQVDRLRDPLLRIGKRYYLRGLLARLRGAEPAQPRPRCVALRSHLRLLPDGGVPVCQFNSERVGSLREQPFARVWRGERARDARRWVDACPGCWAECEVIPNALYTGDIARGLRRGRRTAESVPMATPGAGSPRPV
jgi:MoaA/NifB/PqqE/SkfB family radical SAM enzyme